MPYGTSNESPNAFASSEVMGLVIGPSSSELRQRRELRYSREQAALISSITKCPTEPTPIDLQIRALDQARDTLKEKQQESTQRISRFRAQLADNATDGQSRTEILRQRWVEERRLATAENEENVLVDELSRLLRMRASRVPVAPENIIQAERDIRLDANFSLFLKKSSTLRPLRSQSIKERSSDVPPTNISLKGRARSSASLKDRNVSRRATHTRSRSLMEQGSGVGQQDFRRAECALAPIEASPASSPVKARTKLAFDMNDMLKADVPAVDEFSNSFTSRVIVPSQPSRKTSSRRRSLLSSSKQRTSLMDLRRSRTSDPTNDEGFGTVSILPRPQPSRIDLAKLDNLEVALPDYALDLMNSFGQEEAPQLQLLPPQAVETVIHKFRDPAPLTSVMEQVPYSESPHSPSPSSSVESTPRRKLVRKRSLFTIRIPHHRQNGSMSCSASDSTLIGLGSSSTVTSLTDTVADGTASNRTTEPQRHHRQKGLPSTRNWDLAQLSEAPDDVPATPVKAKFSATTVPLSPSNTVTGTPRRRRLAALRDRLALFARR